MKKITFFTLLLFAITLNGQNKLLSSISTYYNGVSWENSDASNYVYDINNNLVEEQELRWENYKWEKEYKYEFTYDANNKLIEDKNLEWDDFDQVFINAGKTAYSYTGENLTELIGYNWNNSQWEQDYKIEISYSNTKVDVYFWYQWDGANWLLEDRNSVVYVNNKISEVITQEPDGQNWVDVEKQEYGYNGDNIVLQIDSSFESGNWEEYNKLDHTFDVNGNIVSTIEEYEGNKSKLVYSFDTSVLESSLATPFKDKLGLGIISGAIVNVNKTLNREYFFYDEDAEEYVSAYKTSYDYTNSLLLSDSDQLLSSVSEYYNGSSWENSWGASYSYDANNNLIEEQGLNWENNSWVASDSKQQYTYNSNNKVTEEVYSEWDASIQDYKNSYKGVYSYTGNILTEIIDYYWNGTQWDFETKILLSYNGGKPDVVLFNEWNGSAWVNNEKRVFSYNGNNNIDQSLSQEWDGSNWIDDSRTLYSYNVDNNVTTELYEDFDGSNWIVEDRYDYSYDVNGNQISSINEYDGFKYKTAYSFDTSILESTLATPFKDKTGIDSYIGNYVNVHKLLNEKDYYYDVNTSMYVSSNSRTTYNYTNLDLLNTKNINVSTNSLKVYPNPSTDYIQVSGLTSTVTFDVFNVLGRKIISGSLAMDEKIDIQKLVSGTYFLRMNNGRTVKFVK